MTPTVPADRAVTVRVRWPVATLLAGLGLVVALLMGSWVVTQSEITGPATVAVAESVNAVTPGAVSASVTGELRSGEAGNLGGGLCLLGVTCVLALVVVAWRTPSRIHSVAVVAAMVRELASVPRSRVPILTLLQLRVSRT